MEPGRPPAACGRSRAEERRVRPTGRRRPARRPRTGGSGHGCAPERDGRPGRNARWDLHRGRRRRTGISSARRAGNGIGCDQRGPTSSDFPRRAIMAVSWSADSRGSSINSDPSSVRMKPSRSSPVQPSAVSRLPIVLQAAVAELVRLPGDGPFVHAEQVRDLPLAQPVPPAQAEQERLVVVRVPSQSRAAARTPRASGRRRWLAAAAGRCRLRAAACRGRVRRSCETCQFWNTRISHGASGRWPSYRASTGTAPADSETSRCAPELGDGRFLLLLVPRVEPDGPGPQGVHQQAVAPAGAGGEQRLPAPCCRSRGSRTQRYQSRA